MYGSPISGGYGSAYISAILNIKNPLIDLNKSFGDVSKTDLKNYDGFVGTNESKEIGVLEPEQIHILGTKQDIEGFKNFVSTQPKQGPQPGEQLDLFEQDLEINDAQEKSKILNSEEFKNWFTNEATKNPDLDILDALDYYMKCKR